MPEDIFLSLVSFKVTGRVPLVVRGAKVFMSQQSTGIHFGGGHDGYRDAFLKHAVKALQLTYPDTTGPHNGNSTTVAASAKLAASDRRRRKRPLKDDEGY